MLYFHQTKNRFSFYSLILVFFLLFAVNSLKAQIFVDASRLDDSGDGLSLATAKKTINAGILVATAGQTVNIVAGTYPEQVVVNKALTLLGDSPATTIISGGGATGISINAVDVTIQNLTTKGFTNGIVLTIDVAVPNFTTLNNINSSFNTTYGFFTNKSASNLTITNSTLNNNSPAGGRGIMLQSGIAYTNLIFTNNILNNNSLVGIDINGNTALNNVTITGNTINNNGDAGISILAGGASPNTSQLLVSNNQVSMGLNQRFGIEIKNIVGNGLLTGAGSAVVSDNFIQQTAVGDNSRDFAGIVIMRRKGGAATMQDPTGIVVTKNTIRNIRPGTGLCGACAGNIGNGFGIVAGGTNMQITFNNVEGCEVAIQMQASNENSGSAADSPSNTGQANTFFFDRDNAPLSSGTIRYNKITRTLPTDQGIRNIGSVPGSILDATGNWFDDITGPNSTTNATGTGALVQSQSVTGLTAATFVFTPQPTHIAFNPWLAQDPDDLVGTATTQRGVQISSSKTYRATATATTTSVGAIQQGINIANPLIKDILDIRSNITNYPISTSVTINKAITLLGNGGSLPRPELIMQLLPATTRSILIASAQNITIDNLHLKVLGEKGTGTTGAHGIFVANHTTSLAYNNLVIQNNLIENVTLSTVGNGGVNFFAFGIRLSQDGNLNSAGNHQFSILNNTIFSSVGNAVFGRGIRSQGNFGNVTQNTLTCIYGMQIANITGGNLSVLNNTFNVIAEAGIEINEALQNNGVHTISGNTFTTPIANPIGVSAPMLEIKNNGNGILSTVNISNNNFVGVVNFGVFLGRSSNVNVTNNTFTARAGNTVYSHIYINTKFRASAVYVPVVCNNISIKSNTFNGNSVANGGAGGNGILFANHLSGITPAFTNIAVGGNAGTEENNFATDIAKFVVLDPQAGLSTAILPNIWTTFNGNAPATPSNTIAVAENFDAQFNNFDVGAGLQLPTAMTNAQLIALENKISHRIEFQSLGFVTVKANHVFVTKNSFLTGFTTQPRIQRGSGVPTVDGFTLNVEDGIYLDAIGEIPNINFNMDFQPVIIIAGAVVQTPNLIMNGAGKVFNLLGDLTIDNQVTFTNGNIVTNTNKLIFTSVAQDPAIATGEKNNSRIIGVSETVRNVGVGSLAFLGVNIPADIANDLGIVTLRRTSGTIGAVTGIVNVAGNTSIECNWDILPTVNSPRNGVVFSWLPALLNGKDQNNLAVWRFDAGLGVWEQKGANFLAPTTSPLFTTIPVNAAQFSKWTVSDIVNPLPLTWLYVRADVRQRANLQIPVISWATVAEVNTAYFDVERSIDGRNFEKIGEVQAKGSSNINSQNEYSFDDLNAYELAKNVLYYRLRQVDKNKVFVFSRIVSVNMLDKNEDVLVENIYPNPTNGIFNVSLNLKNTPSQSASMKIFDATGKILKTYLIKQDFSQFDVADLPMGMYYLIFSDEKQTKTYKIVRN